MVKPVILYLRLFNFYLIGYYFMINKSRGFYNSSLFSYNISKVKSFLFGYSFWLSGNNFNFLDYKKKFKLNSFFSFKKNVNKNISFAGDKILIFCIKYSFFFIGFEKGFLLDFIPKFFLWRYYGFNISRLNLNKFNNSSLLLRFRHHKNKCNFIFYFYTKAPNFLTFFFLGKRKSFSKRFLFKSKRWHKIKKQYLSRKRQRRSSRSRKNA